MSQSWAEQQVHEAYRLRSWITRRLRLLCLLLLPPPFSPRPASASPHSPTDPCSPVLTGDLDLEGAIASHLIEVERIVCVCLCVFVCACV